jgi:hypothetical protein
VAARYMPDRIGHGHYCKTEGQRNAK